MSGPLSDVHVSVTILIHSFIYSVPLIWLMWGAVPHAVWDRWAAKTSPIDTVSFMVE